MHAEEDDPEFQLPPSQVIGPDENGIKKVIEHMLDENGNRIKITTTYHPRKFAQAGLSKRALQRRSWEKFGDAVNEEVGRRQSGPTMVSTKEIRLEPPRPPGTIMDDELLPQLRVYKVCRICGEKGFHWTSRCPYKNLVSPPERSNITTTSSTVEKSRYVPPALRDGRDKSRTDLGYRDDENSIGVSNLPEDARENDLRELFEHFGSISRVHVATDRRTGSSRCFGFVNFIYKEDAQRAINKLNGYGYGGLILKVEWATPRLN